jgi:hypothetical protein
MTRHSLTRATGAPLAALLALALAACGTFDPADTSMQNAPIADGGGGGGDGPSDALPDVPVPPERNAGPMGGRLYAPLPPSVKVVRSLARGPLGGAIRRSHTREHDEADPPRRRRIRGGCRARPS